MRLESQHHVGVSGNTRDRSRHAKIVDGAHESILTHAVGIDSRCLTRSLVAARACFPAWLPLAANLFGRGAAGVRNGVAFLLPDTHLRTDGSAAQKRVDHG